MAVSGARVPRGDNRRGAVLDAAARLFRERGFHATGMRDIAGAAGMLPGSLYYHFASKEALLLAVYAEGVARIAAHVDAAVAAAPGDPAARLEAACVAHLEMVLDRSDYAQVVIRVLPADVARLGGELARLREGYEARWRGLVAALDLPPGVDRKALRLALLGALNWAPAWYRADGGEGPAALARRLLAGFRIRREEDR